MTAALRQYVVTLRRFEDLDSFYDDMETPGGDLYIPNRAVDLAKRRPLSRNTVYWLNATEAEALRNDPRVEAVELTLEERNIKIEPVWFQNSFFYKGGFTNNNDLSGSDKNWGLMRIIRGEDVPRHGYDDIKRMGYLLQTNLEGNNVDIVIVDGHIRPDHVEFAANVDGTGGSRVNQIDWLSYASAIGKTPPPPPGGAPAQPITYDYPSYYDTNTGDHGALVAAVAAGNTQGWARQSNIYNISPYNETGMVAADDAMDYVRYWHNSVKTINLLTGNKNPTVVNLSWGTYRYINVLDITTITYRGVTYTGPWTNSGNGTLTYTQLGFGYNGAKQYFKASSDLNWYIKITEPIAAWQADTTDLINDGIHVVVAAGNDGLVQDVPTGLDYNNSVATSSYPGGIFYNRRSGPAADPAISVGSIDASSYSPRVDYYSNRGPAVDILAPGSGIVSAINRTTAVAGSVLDSRNVNNSRISIAHGTSLAAPQIAGLLALFLSDPGHQLWTPAFAKTYITGVSKKQQLVDYESPYNLAETPNRYAYYKEFYLTTTTTIGPTTTTTSTTSTTTSTSTSTTTTSTSTTSTTTLYYPPAPTLSIPFICHSIPDPSKFNIVSNVAWYSFTVSSDIDLAVTTTFSTFAFDTEIAVFDINGQVVAENDDTGQQDLSYLSTNLTPGTYWIAVGLYPTQFAQRFRAISDIVLPDSGICITAYDVTSPYTTTTTTSTSTTSTSTTSTSTSTSTTSTTTFAPYPIKIPVPPGYVLQRSWCDNFTLWGLYKNQFDQTWTGIIEFLSSTCGYVAIPTTTTSTSTTTTSAGIPSTWDSTVTRLSILVENNQFTKLPIKEPSYYWDLARGQLPEGVFIGNAGPIYGRAVLDESEKKFGQPAYIYNFGVVVTDPLTNVKGFRQYSITVITNGVLVPNQFLPLDVITNRNAYQYTITSNYTVDLPNKIWKLRWGLLPPSTSLDPTGIINVVAEDDIRPFRREEFLPPNFIDTATNNSTTWTAWLRSFISRPHDFDYQFVVELSNLQGDIDVSNTVRIIHLRPPTNESWFTQNASTLNVDSTRLYYILLSTEYDTALWYTEQDLGSIANGAISKKTLITTNRSGQLLQHIIEPNSNSRIPQGMKLQADGLLVGRPSFRTHIDDPESLPVNDLYEFTVRATVAGDKSFSTRRFKLKVNRVVNTASDNMYIRAFPIVEERNKLEHILNDTSIFPPDRLYRPTDPWFGKRSSIFIEFAFGLNKTSPADYEVALQNNHYNKLFRFGPVGNAVVLNADNQVEYEIVYVTIVDPKLGLGLDTKISESQLPLVDLTGSRTFFYTSTPENDLWYYKDQPELKTYTLTENDLYNMKNRIIESIGYIKDSSLLAPEWSTSPQFDRVQGQYRAPLGFVPVAVLAYVKPGSSATIATSLAKIDFNFSKFEFDRYQLETWLSEYYNPSTGTFVKGVHTIFDGNTTVFDQESTRIIDNQEQYVNKHAADKYIKFPKTGVFR